TIVRKIRLLVVLFVFLGGAACSEPAEINKNVAPAANANVKSPEPATPAPPAATSAPATANLQPVTLPVLDAFFSQESFAAELKSKLQLTDEQVTKLKTIARQETAKLTESGDDTSSDGKATAAREHAIQQTKAAIGEEKTQQLI